MLWPRMVKTVYALLADKQAQQIHDHDCTLMFVCALSEFWTNSRRDKRVWWGSTIIVKQQT